MYKTRQFPKVTPHAILMPISQAPTIVNCSSPAYFNGYGASTAQESLHHSTLSTLASSCNKNQEPPLVPPQSLSDHSFASLYDANWRTLSITSQRWSGWGIGNELFWYAAGSRWRLLSERLLAMLIQRLEISRAPPLMHQTSSTRRRPTFSAYFVDKTCSFPYAISNAGAR